MSSANGSEKLPRRKPKVSWARHILPGLGGPKVRPKGVADGLQVNIPVLGRTAEGVVREDSRSWITDTNGSV